MPNKKSSKKITSKGDSVKLTLYLLNNSTYQIRFYINRKPKTISFNKNELLARQLLKKLSHDLDTGSISLDALKALSGKQIINLYQKEDEIKKEIIESLSENRSIKNIWEKYKSIAVDYLAKSTVNRKFKDVDNALDKLDNNDLLLSNVNNLPKLLLKHYSIDTLKRSLSTLQRALNVIVNNKSLTDKSIKSNDFNLVSLLPKTQSSSIIYYFEPEEIKLILDSFKDSYYYPYVFTLANTGLRPEEAIALKINDIFISNNKVQIKINKVAVDGILEDKTKTHIDRLIPVNPKLASFLIEYCNGKGSNNLLFPSPKGKYINQGNFNTRHFKPIINKLFPNKNDIEKYTTYALRRSFITLQIRQGYDIKTVSSYVGNSPEIIIKKYLGSNLDNITIKDIF